MAWGLTDLGSGVGQGRSPLWSNMAHLTGLGSGRVQSTAGAALTMTALWQVDLRWGCLMCARPTFCLSAVFPIRSFPIRRRCHSIPVSLVLFAFFSLLLQLLFPFSLSLLSAAPLSTAAHYLLSSHTFTFNLTPPLFSHHFKMLSFALFFPFVPSLKFPSSTTASFTLSLPPPFFLFTVISSLFPTAQVVFYSTPQALYYFIAHCPFQT